VLFGKRTLSKMNAFDLVVTVAFGSTLATVLLSKDAALADGVVAFMLLIGLQYAIAWLSMRSLWVENLIRAEPSLLYLHGRFLHEALKKLNASPNPKCVQPCARKVCRKWIVSPPVVLETEAA